jgi:hypothetical protein
VWNAQQRNGCTAMRSGNAGNAGFITVVSGLPRSGTSMMMRMLEAGGLSVLTDNTRRPDEDNPYGYYEFEPVKRLRECNSWLADARGKAVKIVYILLYELPMGHSYKVIFMRRPLGEILASQDAMLRRRGGMTEEEDGGLLAALFDEHQQQLERWLSSRSNIATCYMNYPMILENPRSAAEQVTCFLGLRLNTARMTTVVDARLYRQRQSKAGCG